jgi:hypothetical protein
LILSDETVVASTRDDSDRYRVDRAIALVHHVRTVFSGFAEL